MPTYPQLVIADGASNYWRLGDKSGLTAVDLIGGKDGTISGGVTLNQPSVIGDGDKAMYFDAANDYVRVPVGYLAVGIGPFSIECWVSPAQPYPATAPFILDCGGGANGTGFSILRSNPTQLAFKIANGTTNQIAGLNFPFDGAWHHVVGVLRRGSPDVLEVFIDGVSGILLSLSFSGWNLTSPLALLFSTYSGGEASPDFRYTGLLDEVAIYPIALTPTQILNHYNLRSSDSVTPPTLIDPGPTINITQNVIYALPASSCDVLTGVLVQRSTVALTGPFTDWIGSNTGVVNVGGGWVKCVIGNTTIKATKTKMEFDKYGKKIMKDGASNYWRLNEVSGLVARDIVGGANGTISGGVTLNQAGATKDNDKAMTFDGTTGKIVTAANIPITVTVEGWIKTTATGDRPMLANYTGVSGDIYVGISANAAFMYLTTVGLNGVKILTDGAWHHVVFIAAHLNCRIYVDGQLEASSTTITRTAGSTAPEIGHNATLTQWWLGSLDDVAIYPVALTAAQIAAHYTAGKR